VTHVLLTMFCLRNLSDDVDMLTILYQITIKKKKFFLSKCRSHIKKKKFFLSKCRSHLKRKSNYKLISFTYRSQNKILVIVNRVLVVVVYLNNKLGHIPGYKYVEHNCGSHCYSCKLSHLHHNINTS